MAITSFAELQQAIIDWTNKPELIQLADNFIQLAESDFNSRLRCREMIVRARTTNDDEYVRLPTDFLEAINLQIIGGQTPLRYVTLDQADQIKHAQIYTQVHAYSIMNGAIELIPNPAEDVEIEMVYYAEIPALTSSNTSNWLLNKAPDIYLYGSLLHAAPLLEEDARIPLWDSICNKRIESLNLESTKSLHSGSPLIARVRKVYG